MLRGVWPVFDSELQPVVQAGTDAVQIARALHIMASRLSWALERVALPSSSDAKQRAQRAEPAELPHAPTDASPCMPQPALQPGVAATIAAAPHAGLRPGLAAKVSES